jgi:hypothetical protein
LEKLKTLVPDVPEVPVFKQIDTKNQTNLIINETNNNDPQNTPKNNSINPQKSVTSGISVTDKLIAFPIAIVSVHAPPMTPF